MDKKEGSEKEGCCSGHGCGCCGGKAIKMLIILLLGGVIGYIAGSRCPYHHGACPMPMTNTQPATPSK